MNLRAGGVVDRCAFKAKKSAVEFGDFALLGCQAVFGVDVAKRKGRCDDTVPSIIAVDRRIHSIRPKCHGPARNCGPVPAVLRPRLVADRQAVEGSLEVQQIDQKTA